MRQYYFAIPQEQLRSAKLKKSNDLSPFISTYNSNNSTVFPKVREMYGQLQILKTLGKAFAKHKLIDCKRQPSNLKRLLVLETFQQINQLSKQQNMENVAFVVILLQMGELFKFKDPHQPFILKSNFSCETSNLLYIYIYIYIYNYIWRLQ